jgi:membrane-associated phospholipid phosphatase
MPLEKFNKLLLALSIAMALLFIVALVTNSTRLWIIITDLGEEVIYIALSVALYSFAPSVAFLVVSILLLSIDINLLLKNILAIPRPPKELWRAPASGYSFPSGHAQVSSTFWYSIAFNLRNRYMLLLATIVCISIAVSRVALGVHWVQDVIGGYAIGLALSATSELLSRRLGYAKSVLVILAVTLLLSAPTIVVASEETSLHTLAVALGMLVVTPLHLKSMKMVEGFSTKLKFVNMILTLMLVGGVVLAERRLIWSYRQLLYTLIPIIIVLTPYTLHKIRKS